MFCMEHGAMMHDVVVHVACEANEVQSQEDEVNSQ